MNILIADDHAMVRGGLKQILATTTDMAALAKAAGYNELYFTTSNPKLAAYCEHAFDYEVVPDQFVLRKQL